MFWEGPPHRGIWRGHHSGLGRLCTAEVVHRPNSKLAAIDLSSCDMIIAHATRSSATVKSTPRPSCLIGVLYDISREKNLLMVNQPLLLVATKATEFGEITQNNGHYAVQGHSRSPILIGTNQNPIKRLPISDYN